MNLMNVCFFTLLLLQVRLESIGAEDIVDHNPRLILGLIWTIILRFQIQEIEIDVVSSYVGFWLGIEHLVLELCAAHWGQQLVFMEYENVFD